MTTGSARQAATAAEFSLSLVGTVIKSRYRVSAVASVSREAVVYSAEDVHHGRSIALKVLRDEFARDAQFVAAGGGRGRGRGVLGAGAPGGRGALGRGRTPNRPPLPPPGGGGGRPLGESRG